MYHSWERNVFCSGTLRPDSSSLILANYPGAQVLQSFSLHNTHLVLLWLLLFGTVTITNHWNVC